MSLVPRRKKTSPRQPIRKDADGSTVQETRRFDRPASIGSPPGHQAGARITSETVVIRDGRGADLG